MCVCDIALDVTMDSIGVECPQVDVTGDICKILGVGDRPPGSSLVVRVGRNAGRIYSCHVAISCANTPPHLQHCGRARTWCFFLTARVTTVRRHLLYYSPHNYPSCDGTTPRATEQTTPSTATAGRVSCASDTSCIRASRTRGAMPGIPSGSTRSALALRHGMHTGTRQMSRA